MTDEFNHNSEDVLNQIVDRWAELVESHGFPSTDILHTMIDVKAANGVDSSPELDLDKLLTFDDANFDHNMVGINLQIGATEDHFLAPVCEA